MNIKKQIKLDIISMKPYYTLKNLIIITVLSLFYSTIMKSPATMLSITMIFAVIFSSNPFLLGENSGIDALYKIFSIDSKDVVIGRYILACLLFIATSAIGLIVYTIISLVKNMSIDIDILMYIAINFIIYSIIISTQYPIFFKYGYAKAKTFGFLPIFIIGIIVMLVGSLIKDFSPVLNFVKENQTMILIGFFVLIVLIVIISIKLSLNFYEKRDF